MKAKTAAKPESTANARAVVVFGGRKIELMSMGRKNHRMGTTVRFFPSSKILNQRNPLMKMNTALTRYLRHRFPTDTGPTSVVRKRVEVLFTLAW